MTGDGTPPARPSWAVVVPTVGRPSLHALLTDLAAQPFGEHGPDQVVVVDDRPLDQDAPVVLPGADRGAPRTALVRTGGRGPAAARNAGWRSVRTDWVLFLDDDVRLPAGWAEAFLADLASADEAAAVAGTQARLHVPLPPDRRPTDWERSTAGLEGARWATADMAYRRSALAGVDGFDERFPRAYREDADLALRVRQGGWELVVGTRVTEHPVRPADDAVSVRVQAGARDDVLMAALHGPRWRELAQTGHGRFAWHAATVGLAAAATLALAARRPRLAVLAGAGSLALTGDFLRVRLVDGPRPGDTGWLSEWRRMAWTSAVIPFAAVRHRVAGELAVRADDVAPWRPPVRAVLFDRDGTLVEDVPYNDDPDAVQPVPGAREVLDALRAAGVPVGMVTNQSGVGRGWLTAAALDRVQRRVTELLGPFDVVMVCPHRPDEGCTCRKPGAGLVLEAARRLGVAPWECALVGDIGTDVDAAVAAGARAVLVPTPVTRPEEVQHAESVAEDLRAAIRLLRPDVPLARHLAVA